MSKYGKTVNNLILDLKNGDKDSFGELYRLTKPYLRCVAYSRLRNKSEVNDVLQESFLRFYNHLPNFNPEKDGFNLLYTIVANVAYDFNRANPFLESLDDLAYALADPITSHEATDLLEIHDIQRALKKLMPEQEKLVTLYLFEGKTYDDLEIIYNRSRSTLRERMSKIFAILEKYLKTKD